MRKVLGLFLVLSILFSMVPVYADDLSTEGVNQDVTTDGSSSSAIWFAMFDSLLGDKYDNGLDYYDVLDSIREINSGVPVLRGQVETVYNRLSDSDKVILDEFGFTNSDRIYAVMADYFGSYPITMAQVLLDGSSSSPNIYSEIYHDETLEYSKYMLKFNRYLFDRYAILPSKTQDALTKWDVAGKGQIHINQDILNRFIEDEIFFVVTNLDTGAVSKNMFARSILQTIVEAQVKSAATYGGATADLDEISRFARMYYVVANVMLESIEANLKATDSEDGSNLLDKAISLGRFVDLVDDSTIGPTDDPDPDPDPEPEPDITIVPDLTTIFFNPNAADNESENDQYTAVVEDSDSDVEWSINDNGDIVTIDNTGFVQLNPDFVPNATDSQLIFTVTATLEDDEDVSDTATLELDINPLGAPDFLGAYISGYEDETFRGNNFVTREEMVTMFVRVMKFDIKDYEKDADGNQLISELTNLPIPIYYEKSDFTTESYNDVGKDDWSYVYVEIASEKGWLPADSEGNFKPKKPIIRGEIPMIMVKIWDELKVPVDQVAKHFITDVSSDYKYFDQIQAFYNAKIVTGFSDGSYRPETETTRNEIVSMINNIIDRPASPLGITRFNDVPNGHWAIGDIEAATQVQLIQNQITPE